MLNNPETAAEICLFIGQQHHRVGETGRSVSAFLSAIEWYRRGLAEYSGHTKTHEALAMALIAQRQHAEAIPHLTEAMKSPDKNRQFIAQTTRGLTYLHVGDYLNGFADMERRSDLTGGIDVPYLQKIAGIKLWEGKPCKHLVVYGEQGFGDVIMFSRFLSHVLKHGLAERITLEVPGNIVSLMAWNLRGQRDVRVTAYAPRVTVADEYTLMVSLARWLGVTRETVPAIKLEAESSYVEKWGSIGSLAGLKVGICWSGREAKDIHTAHWNSLRNIKLMEMLPVLAQPASFVSLQKGEGLDQLSDFPSIHTPAIESWSDTAGVIHYLDLVISIDSGPVHLAAALGKPTWLLNHLNSCWRWELAGERTPWYENVRIFRQESEGDWSKPVSAVAEALANMLNKHSISKAA